MGMTDLVPVELLTALDTTDPKEREVLYAALLSHKYLSLKQVLVFAVDAEQIELVQKIIQHPAFTHQVYCYGAPELKTKVVEFLSSTSPDIAIKLFPEHPEVISTAYDRDPSAIRYAALEVVKDLVQQDRISCENALSAFRDEAYFQQLLLCKNKLASIEELHLDASDTDLEDRFILLSGMVTQITSFPNTMVRQLEKLAHDLGAHLIQKINDSIGTMGEEIPDVIPISSTEGLYGEQLVEAIINLVTQKQKIDALIDLHKQHKTPVNTTIVTMGEERQILEIDEEPGGPSLEPVILTTKEEVQPELTVSLIDTIPVEIPVVLTTDLTVATTDTALVEKSVVLHADKEDIPTGPDTQITDPTTDTISATIPLTAHAGEVQPDTTAVPIKDDLLHREEPQFSLEHPLI